MRSLFLYVLPIVAQAFIHMWHQPIFEKVQIAPNDKVRLVVNKGRHFVYYDGRSKMVKYRYMMDATKNICLDTLFDRCPTISDIDLHEQENSVFVAMASYHNHHHSIQMTRIDTKTFRTEKLPILVHHPTHVRKSSFVHFNNTASLVSWSIDGTQSVFSLKDSTCTITQFPFKVFHACSWDDMTGIIDDNHVFHVFYPDGEYKNITLDGITHPISCFHFWKSSRQLSIGTFKGDLMVYSKKAGYFERSFHAPILSVYTDDNKYIVALDNGSVIIGGLDEGLTEYYSLSSVFDPNYLQRAVVGKHYLIIDGDNGGLVVRDWTKQPSSSSSVTLSKRLPPPFGNEILRKALEKLQTNGTTTDDTIL